MCRCFLVPNSITQLEERASLTFFLGGSRRAGLGHFSADRLLLVLLLDRQRNDGNLRKLLPPPGSILLNEHLGDPVDAETTRGRSNSTVTQD